MREAFAHSLAGRPKEEWHRLEDHLKGTAEKAARFAGPWGAADLAYLAGLWHDLGKYTAAFQHRIGALDGDEAHVETKPGRVDHSTAGAIFAMKQLDGSGLPIAMAIAGHHAGLGNLHESVKPRLGRKELLDAAMEGCSGAGWLAPAQRPVLSAAKALGSSLRRVSTCRPAPGGNWLDGTLAEREQGAITPSPGRCPFVARCL